MVELVVMSSLVYLKLFKISKDNSQDAEISFILFRALSFWNFWFHPGMPSWNLQCLIIFWWQKSTATFWFLKRSHSEWTSSIKIMLKIKHIILSKNFHLGPLRPHRWAMGMLLILAYLGSCAPVILQSWGRGGRVRRQSSSSVWHRQCDLAWGSCGGWAGVQRRFGYVATFQHWSVLPTWELARPLLWTVTYHPPTTPWYSMGILCPGLYAV